MEKPAAVDPVGIRTVMVAARQAQPAGLTVVTGNQRRHCRDYWEAYIFDFFSVDCRYENNKRMMATARQIDGCDNDVSESIMGTVCLLYLGGNTWVGNFKGEVVWKYDKEANPVKNPYDKEHVHLVESIRLNKKINQAEDIANSTMVAILGREAAYTGKVITWEEIMASPLLYGPTEYTMGPVPGYEEGVAHPSRGNGDRFQLSLCFTVSITWLKTSRSTAFLRGKIATKTGFTQPVTETASLHFSFH